MTQPELLALLLSIEALIKCDKADEALKIISRIVDFIEKGK